MCPEMFRMEHQPFAALRNGVIVMKLKWGRPADSAAADCEPALNSVKAVNIEVGKISPNRSQPRKHFDTDEITRLAKSISQMGILQPLIVRGSDGGYELIAGERRLRAAKQAGMRFVPCLISDADDKQSALMALVENLQRENLSFFEQADGFRRLIDEYGLTQQEAAVKLGIAQPTVANKLRLLRLSGEQRTVITSHGLSERHARALLRLDEERRDEVLDVVCKRGLSADAMEKYIDAIVRNKRAGAKQKKKYVVLKDVRLFINTVEKALNVMRLAGVDAYAEKKQEGEFIEYAIRIRNSEFGEEKNKSGSEPLE